MPFTLRRRIGLALVWRGPEIRMPIYVSRVCRLARALFPTLLRSVSHRMHRILVVYHIDGTMSECETPRSLAQVVPHRTLRLLNDYFTPLFMLVGRLKPTVE